MEVRWAPPILYFLCRLAPLVFVASLYVCFLIYHETVSTLYLSTNNLEDTMVCDTCSQQQHLPGTHRHLPQVLIIGVRKGGTRALLEMLHMHPDIQKNSEEMHFFDIDERYAKGLEWYRKKMPYTFENQVTVEKTPAYFISTEAPARIRAMNDSIRLLLIVRDPTKRVLSDYTQIMQAKLRKGIKVANFSDKVILPDGEINDKYKAIQISQYALHMMRWLRFFSLEQIHVIDGDKLITDPYPEIVKVQNFLHLPLHITESNFVFNETKGFFCLRNDTTQKCLADSKGRAHPYVDVEVISRVRQFFAPFNEQFYEMIGRNFSWAAS